MNYDYLKYFLKFLPLAAIGTFLHELGHFFAALFQGIPSWISYGATHIPSYVSLTDIQAFIIYLGGPISTWLTCLIGLLLLIFIFRKRLSDQNYTKMSTGHQLSFFITLFCSRAVFNTSIWIVGKYFLGMEMGTSDEEVISAYLGIPPEIILFGGFIIGISIILVSLFYLIPRSQTKMIIITGLIGSLSGYLLWYELLGPIILPVPAWS